MVTLHEVITFLVSMQISISSLQTHNVIRCGRSRHLARKLSLKRKRSSPNVFEMAESSSVPTTLATAYDVYPLDGRHDGGYYTVKDCVTIDVLPRTPGNNVYVGFMVWSNFTATKCRG